MKRIYISIIALGLVLIIGCARPGTNDTSDSTDSDELIAKAEALAQSELMRLNAIEMVYRNIPEVHRYSSPATLTPESGWVKVYRRISSFEVNDVRRTDSVLHPVIYEVDYKYDVFGTLYRNNRIINALELSRSDSQFAIRYSGVIKHTYQCDTNGDLVKNTGLILTRPNFFIDDIYQESVDPPNSPKK